MERTERMRKIARVWSAIAIGVAVVIGIVEVVFPHTEGPVPFFEWMLLVLFPVIPLIGLALAWRWEFWGSTIALVSAIAFIIIISIDRERILTALMVTELAIVFPAILYLICWNIERKEAQLAA
jgi:hypothetical protein